MTAYRVTRTEGIKWSMDGLRVKPEHCFNYSDIIDSEKVPASLISHYLADKNNEYFVEIGEEIEKKPAELLLIAESDVIIEDNGPVDEDVIIENELEAAEEETVDFDHFVDIEKAKPEAEKMKAKKKRGFRKKK